MLFVVPHEHRDDISTVSPPVERIVDITAAVEAGQAHFMPSLPASVVALYGPTADPIATPPPGLSIEERLRYVLAAVMTPSRPRYIELADEAVPGKVRVWLAEEPDCLLVLTWITHYDSYESLLAADGWSRVHMVVRQVPPDLIRDS
jgi:hypothetical protein